MAEKVYRRGSDIITSAIFKQIDVLEEMQARAMTAGRSDVVFEISDKLGASVLEVTTREKTEGTLGFLWCGKFGMLKKDMPINFDEDLSKYKKVIICTPIWIFTMSSP